MGSWKRSPPGKKRAADLPVGFTSGGGKARISSVKPKPTPKPTPKKVVKPKKKVAKKKFKLEKKHEGTVINPSKPTKRTLSKAEQTKSVRAADLKAQRELQASKNQLTKGKK